MSVVRNAGMAVTLLLVACSDAGGDAHEQGPMRASAQRIVAGSTGCTLPDPDFTPGKLCTPDDPDFASYRYPEHIAYCARNVKRQEKQAVAAHYGVPRSDWSNYEFDHLIPLSIGGSDDITNIWPQPLDQAHEKDQVEDEVFQGLKSGKITQAEAVDRILAWRPSGCPAPQSANGPDASHAPVETGRDADAPHAASTEPLRHVFVIVLENKSWSTIVGNSSAPYLNRTLLVEGAHAERYMNVPGLHPSEPNYVWMEAGDSLGIRDDRSPRNNHRSTREHLVTQLTAAGVSWRSYQEGIDGRTCPLEDVGHYATKHNPFVFFDDVTGQLDPHDSNCIAHNRPLTELADDLAHDAVAQYNFITPDLCHDMHGDSGCPRDRVKTGDDWLAEIIPQIQRSAAYRDGVVFVTFDENEGGNAPIGMIALSPKAKAGYASSQTFSHSSLLRSVQEIFGVGPFLGDAANASDLADLFVSFP